MPPRRRPQKSRPVAATTRVRKIVSPDQFQTMLDKAGAKRVVFVNYISSQNAWTSNQMKPFFGRASTTAKFRHAIFAEVNADHLEDLAREEGVTRVPAFFCYHQGEVVDRYEGGRPEDLNNFIANCLQEYCPGSGRLGMVFKAVAAAAIIAGGAFFALRGGGAGGAGGSGATVDIQEQILDLKKRITAAQTKLRNVKGNRGKQARAQRKLLDGLTAQLRGLERRARGAAGKDTAAAGKAEEGRHGSDKSSRGGVKLSGDDLARLRRRKMRGEAMYSDEEDTLAAAEAAADEF